MPLIAFNSHEERGGNLLEPSLLTSLPLRNNIERRKLMTTYYRGPDVLITDQVFVIWTPPQRVYQINELSDCCVLEGDRPPVRLYAVGALGVAILVAVAAAPGLQ